MTRILTSLAIGVSIAIGLFFGSGFVVSKGFSAVGQAMLWQEPLLQELPAWHSLVSPQSPLFDTLTLLGALVLGVIMYSLIGYAGGRDSASMCGLNQVSGNHDP